MTKNRPKIPIQGGGVGGSVHKGKNPTFSCFCFCLGSVPEYANNYHDCDQSNDGGDDD